MSLEEVLQVLKKAPQLMLYLDVKIDGDLTAGAEDYAQAVSRLWETAGLPNRLYIEGPSAESLAAFRSVIKRDFVPLLSYPAFSAKGKSPRTALMARWLTRRRVNCPWTAARCAQAGVVSGSNAGYHPVCRHGSLGTTLTFPVDRHHSVKLYASTGVQTRTGGNFDLLGIAWQYRWGGGL
jgi:hypothetical protein